MRLFNKKDIPIFIFHRTQLATFFIGVGLIIIFFGIFLYIAIKNWQLNFYSFLFRNLKNHVFLTILSGFHVGILGSGILLILIAFFNMTLKAYCYNDRFVISMFLQKKKIIEFNKIDKIIVKTYYLNYENLFKKYNKKECRVFFNNPAHAFYLAYPVNSYFDDIEINLNIKKEDLSARCIADRESILTILKNLKKINSINIPYLPEEAKE